MRQLLGAALLVGGLLAGCHSHDHEHAEVPEHHADRESPFGPDDAEAQAAGQAIYDARCATCHGAAGMGDGELATSLDPIPSDFTMGHADSWTDPYLYYRIADGPDGGPDGTSMPAFADTLSEAEIWQVIAYSRTLAGQ